MFHIAVNVSGNQVMHIGASLGLFQDAPAGCKDIIVYQERAVVYLQEQVLHVIIIEQVARYAGSLRHPVQPKGTAGVMDTVMDNPCIHSGMEFDTSDLGAGKLAFHPDIVDMVVFDQAESGSHTSAYTGLLAMGYSIRSGLY